MKRMKTETSNEAGGLLAIIGGTGLDARDADSPLRQALRDVHDETVTTRWGTAQVTRAHLDDRPILFLHRHAAPDAARSLPPRNLPPRSVPPHRVNYRANIAALKTLGATAILASTAVGSLRPEWSPGTLVLLDQFLDFTTSRDKTFFDERSVHVDLTEPYCPRLRSLLALTASDLNIALHDGGAYACTDGPRFETPAEIRAYAHWGADVVGMTGMPEVVLAREANISYAGVSIVSNLAAGVSPQPLTQAEVLGAMRDAMPQIITLFLSAARDYQDDPATPSRRATAEYGWPDVV